MYMSSMGKESKNAPVGASLLSPTCFLCYHRVGAAAVVAFSRPRLPRQDRCRLPQSPDAPFRQMYSGVQHRHGTQRLIKGMPVAELNCDVTCLAIMIQRVSHHPPTQILRVEDAFGSGHNTSNHKNVGCVRKFQRLLTPLSSLSHNLACCLAALVSKTAPF